MIQWILYDLFRFTFTQIQGSIFLNVLEDDITVNGRWVSRKIIVKNDGKKKRRKRWKKRVIGKEDNRKIEQRKKKVIGEKNRPFLHNI